MSTLKDIREEIENISNDELIDFANEIYDFKYVYGFLLETAAIYKFARERVVSVRDVEEMVLDELENRFSNAAKLLICDRPAKFFNCK